MEETKDLNIVDTDRVEDILSELNDSLYELCVELVATPFFMFKKVWQLKAQIKQIKSIKIMINEFA